MYVASFKLGIDNSNSAGSAGTIQISICAWLSLFDFCQTALENVGQTAAAATDQCILTAAEATITIQCPNACVGRKICFSLSPSAE